MPIVCKSPNGKADYQKHEQTDSGPWCCNIQLNLSLYWASIFPSSHVYMCMVSMHVCTCMFTWVHMHVCVSAHGGLRLIMRIFNYSSTLLTEEGSLNQNQSSSIWVVSSASLLQDDLSLPSEARVTSKSPYLLCNLCGFWGLNAGPYPCLASILTTEPPLQHH